MVFHSAVEHFWRSWEAAEHTHPDGVLPHIITSNVEHDSVKLAAEHLQTNSKAGRKQWDRRAQEMLSSGFSKRFSDRCDLCERVPRERTCGGAGRDGCRAPHHVSGFYHAGQQRDWSCYGIWLWCSQGLPAHSQCAGRPVDRALVQQQSSDLQTCSVSNRNPQYLYLRHTFFHIKII